MVTWSEEVKELEKSLETVKGRLPDLEKELDQLNKTQDPNVAMLYSRRCLEVIITDLCENELKRPRKTEPLKGIIDKLLKEEKVPSHIITSMHGLNSLSTYGTHPRDFDPEQVKPALSNLSIILKWYLKYKSEKPATDAVTESKISIVKPGVDSHDQIRRKKRRLAFTISSILAVVAAIVVVLKLSGIMSGSSVNLEKSIAVLPFKNDSPDDSTLYFMNGVMEELLTNLQKIKDLRVLGRTSVEQFRNLQDKTIPEIAKELGVNYIVEGSGQKSGNSFRMRVQLIRAKKESHIWAKSFEKENINIKEYFNTQSRFAEEIAGELNAAITPQEKQLIDKIPTERLDAYEAYLKGQFYWRKLTAEGFEIALSYFNRAKEIDPDYALAYTGICDVWIGRQQIGAAPPEIAGPKAYEAAMKAMELDSTRAEVYYTMALMTTWGMFDWQSGEKFFKKAIELKPNYPEARLYYSHLLNLLGRREEARIQGETGLKQDPVNPLVISLYAIDLYMFRQYEESIKMANEAVALDPSAILALSAVGYSSSKLGKPADVVEAFKKVYNYQYPNVAHAFKPANNEAEALKILHAEADTLVRQRDKTYILPIDITQFYLFAGDTQNAMIWINKAFEEKDPNLPYILMPLFDPVRNDPRFQEIARKMNLPYK